MIKIFLINLALLTKIFAHEGHADVSAKSQHGGVIKRTTNYYIEVLQEGETWEVYIMDHNYKNAPLNLKSINGEMVTKNLKTNVVLKINGDHLLFSDNLKNEKHFKLNIAITSKSPPEQVSFNLEKQGK